MVSPSRAKSKTPLRRIFEWIIVIFIVLVLIGVALGPTGGGMPRSYGLSSQAMERSRAIYELMKEYADAHQGAFPTGNSSTEIFQKLVDENHLVASGKTVGQLLSQVGYNEMEIRDTAIFYLDMPGKTLATSTKLKPENVCFDVTAPLDGAIPDDLPVVFTTGYKIDYLPNKAAVPIAKSSLPGWAAISYAGGNSYGIWADKSWSSQEPLYFLQDHSIANFISADFNSNGKKYQQLTPDGPLGP